MKDESAARWLGKKGGDWLCLLSVKRANQREEEMLRFPIPKLNKLSLKSCCL